MSGLSTIYVFSELSLQLEKAAIKVRRELLRIGCHLEINVELHGGYMRLTYKNEDLIAHPLEILGSLGKIKEQKSSKETWRDLNRSCGMGSNDSVHRDYLVNVKSLASLLLVPMLIALLIYLFC